MSADGADGDGEAKQRFELYIKASAIDKETKGSCPICQHWFMITCLLGENQDDIDFKVYTVQADCPPKNFGVDQGWSKKFPVVMVLAGHDKKGQDLAGTKYDTFEELETFFESINKESKELKRKNAPNVAAMGAVEDVYNAFNGFVSGKGPKRLEAELKKINEFLLDEDDSKFLVDNVLSFADCYLLPRLQHIRVAGKAYMNYDIPEKFSAIWKYLAEAYKTEAFRSTMPSDQDIIFHYEKKFSSSSGSQKVKVKSRPTLQSFTYTMDIPEDIAASLNGSVGNTNGDVSQQVEETQQLSDGLSQMDISPQAEFGDKDRVHEEAIDEVVVENAVNAEEDAINAAVSAEENAVNADGNAVNADGNAVNADGNAE